MILSIIDYFQQIYDDYAKENSDPRTADWYTTQSLKPVLIAVFCYAIFSTIIGPRFMKNRKPFEIRKLVIIYNGLQCLLSFYIFYYGSKYAWFTRYKLPCEPHNVAMEPLDIKCLQVAWIGFLSRFFEFFDTIFFVLRKNNRQITALHVIHHSIVPISFWLAIKFVPIGHYTFGAYINAFIHIIMYFYYMLAACGPQFKKYLWWKKYLTILQLVQFVIILAHTLYTIFSDCPVPKMMAYVVAFEALLFFVLFLNFYRAEYKKKEKLRKHVK